MNKFVSKLVMLLMFILFVLAGWASITMSFQYIIWNILLAIVALFFLFRALERVDRINGLGTYSNQGPDSPGEKIPGGGYVQPGRNEFPRMQDRNTYYPHTRSGYDEPEEPVTTEEGAADDMLVPDEE